MILEEVDLSLSREHDHPHVNTEDRYLCMIGGTYWVGKFDRSNRGLIFHGWHDNAILYDRPGLNDSHWNKIYRIVETSQEQYNRENCKQNQKERWRPRSKKVVRNSSGRVILKYKQKHRNE